MKKQLSLLTLLALAACGGGAGSSIPTAGSAAQPQLQNVAVQFSISIPAAVGKVPQYISSATKSAQITVTPAGGTALSPVVLACTTTCQGTVPAPVGSDNFAVALYDQLGAAGNTLSSGSATQTILAGQANAVNLTFGGVVAKIAIALGATSVTGSGSTAVTVTARDAASQTIVGSASYVNPITLTNSDTSGAATLSTTSVTSPNTLVTLNYTNALTSAQIGATATNVSPSQITSATLTRATATAAAAFMTQTSATKVSATLPAGATSGIVVAISGATDQSATPGFNLDQITFGTGASATSALRMPQQVSSGHFSGPHFLVGRAPDTDRLDAILRSASLSGLPRISPRRAQSVLPSSLVPGATANIWVASSTYIQVPATLEYNSTHGHIWIDNSLITGGGAVAAFAPSSIASTVTQIGDDFENSYSSDTTHFGTADYPATAPALQMPNYSACDTSGTSSGSSPLFISEPSDKMIDVMVLNPTPLGGFGGYFSSTNFISQAVLNCSYGPNSANPIYSNEAPFIFVGWNPRNSATAELQEDLVRGTAHEFQHFINFINHSILPSGASSPGFNGHEDTFINEGLSMLSQDLAVHQLRPTQPFDTDDALFNAGLYLPHPEDVALTSHYGKNSPSSTPQSGCNACYGGDYLFQRYMYDRFGGDVYTKGMETSGITGFPNLVLNATGSDETANQLLSDFGMAMAVNAAGVAPPTAAFNMGTLNLSGTYQGIFGANSMPGVGFASAPLSGNASASVSAPIGGFAFLQITNIPGAGEPLTINDISIGGTFGLAGGLVQH